VPGGWRADAGLFVDIESAESLLAPSPADRDRFATDTPVIGIDFIDHDNGSLGVLAQNIDQKLGDALNQASLLFRGRTFFCDFDVYVWHFSSRNHCQHGTEKHPKTGSTAAKPPQARPPLGVCVEREVHFKSKCPATAIICHTWTFIFNHG
jgi:hypothetical protein